MTERALDLRVEWDDSRRYAAVSLGSAKARVLDVAAGTNSHDASGSTASVGSAHLIAEVVCPDAFLSTVHSMSFSAAPSTARQSSSQVDPSSPPLLPLLAVLTQAGQLVIHNPTTAISSSLSPRCSMGPATGAAATSASTLRWCHTTETWQGGAIRFVTDRWLLFATFDVVVVIDAQHMTVRTVTSLHSEHRGDQPASTTVPTRLGGANEAVSCLDVHNLDSLGVGQHHHSTVRLAVLLGGALPMLCRATLDVANGSLIITAPPIVLSTGGSAAPVSVRLSQNGRVAFALMSKQVIIFDADDSTDPHDWRSESDPRESAKRFLGSLAVPGQAISFDLCEASGLVLVSTISGLISVFSLPLAVTDRLATTTAAHAQLAAESPGASRGGGVLPPSLSRPMFTLKSSETAGRLLTATACSRGQPLQLRLLRGTWALPRAQVVSIVDFVAGRFPPVSGSTAANVATGNVVSVPLPDDYFTIDPTSAVATGRAALKRRSAAEKISIREALRDERVMLTEANGGDDRHADASSAIQQLARVGSAKLLPKMSTVAASPGASTLTGVVVPLTQALHANDTSVVLELTMLAAKDAESTIRHLSRPFLLKLIHILTTRTLSGSGHDAGIRSPLHKWIALAVQLRGAEFMSRPTDDATTKLELEIARRALRPLADRYERLNTIRDPIAFMYGRMSIFKAVRPVERHNNNATSSSFPVSFDEPSLQKATRRANAGKSCPFTRRLAEVAEDAVDEISASDEEEASSNTKRDSRLGASRATQRRLRRKRLRGETTTAQFEADEADAEGSSNASSAVDDASDDVGRDAAVDDFGGADDEEDANSSEMAGDDDEDDEELEEEEEEEEAAREQHGRDGRDGGDSDVPEAD